LRSPRLELRCGPRELNQSNRMQIRPARRAVTVVHPERTLITIPVLPGQTQAYTDAPIFAQTNGYLRKWYFDIGAKVKAGDVLAEIDAPDVDQELAQAQAQLKVAQEALNLAKSPIGAPRTFSRGTSLPERILIQLLTPIARTRRWLRQTRRISISLKRSKDSKSSRHHSTVLSRRETPIWRPHRGGLRHPALSDAADFTVTRLCQRASGFCRSGKNRH
jgi:multidrug efflux pump subunit AcrA (membrane-fusion protein)